MRVIVIIFIVAALALGVCGFVVLLFDRAAEKRRNARQNEDARVAAEKSRAAETTEAHVAAEKSPTAANPPVPIMPPLLIVPTPLPAPIAQQPVAPIAQQPVAPVQANSAVQAAKAESSSARFAIAFPAAARKPVKNAVFSPEWKAYRENLIRYAASLGIACTRTAAGEESFVRNGKCVLKCYFVPDEYSENLSYTNQLYGRYGLPVMNVSNEARLRMAESALRAAV